MPFSESHIFSGQSMVTVTFIQGFPFSQGINDFVKFIQTKPTLFYQLLRCGKLDLVFHFSNAVFNSSVPVYPLTDLSAEMRFASSIASSVLLFISIIR